VTERVREKGGTYSDRGLEIERERESVNLRERESSHLRDRGEASERESDPEREREATYKDRRLERVRG
jgi:hypothetical protein